MKYADATRCPDCRAGLEGQMRCGVCGFDLDAPEVPQIWEHLEQIDDLVAAARSHITATAAAPSPPPAPVAGPPPFPLLGTSPVPLASLSSGAGVSAGSVILGLGATLLVLAAVIFVSFAWSVVGVGGRAAILALLTVLVGVAGGWSLRRGLRGSTEALWLVFAGFVSADWFAACGLGLMGLDGLSGWQVATPWWILLSVTSAAVGAASRRLHGRPVVTLEVAAGLSLVPVVATVGESLDDLGVRVFWVLAILTLVAGAVTVAVRLVGQLVWATIAALVAVATGVAMLVAAVAEAAANREVGEYVGQAHGLPLLLVTSTVVVLAVWRPAREAAVAGATVLVALLVALPVAEALDGQGWFVWLTVLVVVIASARLVPALASGPVGTGLLIGSGTLTLVVVIGWSTGFAPVLAALDEAFRGPRDLPFLLATREVGTDGRLAPWAAHVGGAGLAVTSGLAAAWPQAAARSARRQLVLLAGVVACATVLAVLAELGAAVVVLGAVVVLTGIGLTVAARWCGPGWRFVGLGLVAFAPVLVVPTWDGLVVGAVVSLVVLLGLTVVHRSDRTFASTAALATAAWVLLVTLLAIHHPDVDLAVRPGVSIVLVVALLLTVTGCGLQQPPAAWRPGLLPEGVGVLAAGLALLVGAVAADPAWLAAWCTGAGVVAVAIGLLLPPRRWARWVGASLLGAAWILRLAASDVTTVEAYTLPFAAVAVAVGAMALRRDGSLGTFAAWGGGLALGLVPSTVVALTDPVSLRALLVGVAAFALVGLGLAWRWKAPFVLGGATLLVVAVVELAPYGWALPRWVLLGAAGVLLLVGGITWEDRVRDGRAVARFVRSMR